MKYLVLIGDVLGSKQLPARAQFQRRLKSSLQGLNERRKTLASPYTLTLGDEFQAVYRDATGLFADIFVLLAQVAPVQARFAVAVGEIVTPLNPRQSIGMDGPAFHRARVRLERLKGQGRLLGIHDPGDGRWKLPGATLAVLSGLIEGWRQKRLQLFAGMLAGTAVPELAKQTGITTRAVNKNIRAADLDEWKRIVDEISRLLNEEIKAR
jgi:SatD family (SatD)